LLEFAVTSLVVLKESNIVHCDLKPENILLRHQKRISLKLIGEFTNKQTAVACDFYTFSF